MKYTKEQLNEKYRMLPKELQEVMLSSKSTENVKKIGEKHGLHVDKIGELGEEVWFTMLGVKRTVDFIKNIKVRLNLPDEKINAIAKDINERVFLQVREVMKKMQNVSASESVNTSSPADINLQQGGNVIHHEPLVEDKDDLSTDSSAETSAEEEEFEEIKQQIAQQSAPRSVAEAPANLPTGVPADASAEQKEEKQKPNFENKKPSHVDPYREPLE